MEFNWRFKLEEFGHLRSAKFHGMQQINKSMNELIQLQKVVRKKKNYLHFQGQHNCIFYHFFGECALIDC